MALAQLKGRYVRLSQELAMACIAQPRHGARIDRLANDLALTEREIAAADDAQRGNPAPGSTPWLGATTRAHGAHA